MRRYMMQRVSFLLKIKPDKIEEYKEFHRNVWPEMLEALHRNGWRNYSLFMREDGLLFGYFETPDLAAAHAGMAKEEVNARWQATMRPFFDTLGGEYADRRTLPLEEVFHLD
jgi:L-rhamnose mutarotase